MSNSSISSSASSSLKSVHTVGKIIKSNFLDSSEMSSNSISETIRLSKNETLKQVPETVEFKDVNLLRRRRLRKLSKKSFIDADTEQCPLDFATTNKKNKHNRYGTRNEDRSNLKAKNKRNVRNTRIGIISDDEVYIMTDVFDYQQLPNMSDFSEGCIGFLSTALAVFLLICVSFITVFSIDVITDCLEGAK